MGVGMTWPADGTVTAAQRVELGWEPEGFYRNAHTTPARPKESTVTITPGELRGRTQPTLLLRMTSPVDAAPGNTDGPGKVFMAGDVVFAQYVGNGRLLLTPVRRTAMTGPQVVMASALNTTAEIIDERELDALFAQHPKPLDANTVPFIRPAASL
jgi:hypothetical protein